MLFFSINFYFFVLYIGTIFYRSHQKISNNEILIFISKLIGLDQEVITSNNFLILLFVIIVIFSNLIFIFSNLIKFNFSYDLLTNLRSKLYNYYLRKNFEQFIKKKITQNILRLY